MLDNKPFIGYFMSYRLIIDTKLQSNLEETLNLEVYGENMMIIFKSITDFPLLKPADFTNDC